MTNPMYAPRRIAVVLALCAIVGSLAACGGGSSAIGVRDAWARPAVAVPSDATPMGDHTMPMGNGATPMGSATPMGNDPSAMMMGGSNSVAYLTIINTGDGKDTLVGISSDVAGAVQLHRTAITNNVASMSEVNSVDIPAHGEVRFAPGSYHLVLANVRRTLAPGDTIDLTLTFKNAGQIQVRAEVREQ